MLAQKYQYLYETTLEGNKEEFIYVAVHHFCSPLLPKHGSFHIVSSANQGMK
jgi:hypothetical protein